MKNANGSKKLAGMASAAMLLINALGVLNAPMSGINAPTKNLQGRKNRSRNGRGKPGAYGRGLRNAITAKTKTTPFRSDSNGAFTLVGRDPLRRINEHGADVRRMWLAGISAQRGY